MASVAYVILGLVLAFFGLGAAWNAEEVARKDEQYDAVGSTRNPLEVEPAAWNVQLTRSLWGIVGIAGVVLVVYGLVA